MQQALFNLQFEPTEDYLYAKTTGVRSRETVASMTMEVFEEALSRGLSLVLVDVRKLEGRLGALDSYFVVTDVFQKIRGKGIHKAAILDTHVATIREWFLELVARNRGFNFRIFDDRRSAAEWLHEA